MSWGQGGNSPPNPKFRPSGGKKLRFLCCFRRRRRKNLAFLGVFHTKSALTIFTNVVGKAADARTYTYFLNLINNIQRLTQASQRRQKWRFFLPFLQKDGEFRNFRPGSYVLIACGQRSYCLWTSTGNKPSIHCVFLLPVDEILIACGRISSPNYPYLRPRGWIDGVAAVSRQIGAQLAELTRSILVPALG